MTTKELKNIVLSNRNRTLEVTDEMFHRAFKPEQFKGLILETEADHLNRFLIETGILYREGIGIDKRHYFTKPSPEMPELFESKEPKV